MKKFINLLFSTKTTAIMLALYAISMAWATLIENNYGTPVAKALIYNSTWFEIIMLILILNFIGNIQRYQLWSIKKWPVLIFHISFIFLFVGGAITRYISYEGQMHIRENETTNQVTSEGTFLKTQITNDKGIVKAYNDIPFIFTPENIPFLLKPFQKKFNSKYDYLGKIVQLESTGFIPWAQDSIQPLPNGKKILKLITTSEEGRKTEFIEEGTSKQIQNALVAFNVQNPDSTAIHITSSPEDELTISSPLMGRRMVMTTQQELTVQGENKAQPLQLASLYQFPNLTFVVPTAPERGKIVHYAGDKNKNSSDPDLIFMKVSSGNDSKEFSFYGKKGWIGLQKQVMVDGLLVSVGYGSKIYKTEPFYLKLNKFIMEHYPGSNSPSAYESEVSIIDEGKEIPYKIYMNHILNYKGYRFFQSSFDPDLKGTILSVNHDFWGTTITYIGYALLILGMFTTLFWKGTRFWKLNDQLKKIAKNKKMMVLLLFLSSLITYSQNIDMHGTEDGSIKKETIVEGVHEGKQIHENSGNSSSSIFSFKNSIPKQPLDPKVFSETIKIPKEHADKFGEMLVQSFDGRIQPTNTLALEILRKIHKSDKFYDLDANQFLISISLDPLSWSQVPLIKVSNKGGEDLKKLTRANEDGYTTLMNLFPPGPDGLPYFVLDSEYKKSFAKKPAERSNYDKEIIELNDKLQALQAVISGLYLRFIPIQNDPKNTWTSWATPDFKTDSIATRFIGGYFRAVMDAEKTGNWKLADEQLNRISEYQYKWGKQVIPSETKIHWEIRYNHWNIFFKIMIVYALLGTVLLTIAFVKLFLDKSSIIAFLERSLLLLVIITFILHGFGLGIRWYISGHEPWSNGYEAVMFISWISVLSGFILYRNRNGFIPAAGCLVAVILMGFAHGGDQMNPQITPLVPVLKSYWLMIHVAIITSSYGFFGLSALIGTVVLLLFTLNNKKISLKVEDSIRELTIVNEISLTIGIFLLTVGTFLGGVWANESWGRYWSWDPKETWAFISVIIYAVVLHIRLVPGWRGKYIFNLLSLLSFSSVIMTYFGVNYYLSGLHSYAQGDPVPVPNWVYIVIAIVTLLAISSYFAHKRKFNK